MQRIQRIKRSKTLINRAAQLMEKIISKIDRRQFSYLIDRSERYAVKNERHNGRERQSKNRSTEQCLYTGIVLCPSSLPSSLFRGAVFRAANDAFPVESLWTREPVALLK